MNVLWSNAISGKRMTTGTPCDSIKPPAAAIQPAGRPITSSTKTLVEVRAIERTSNDASSAETATYFATEPKPGQQSVIGRSLSTVFGTWIACSEYPIDSESWLTLKQVSAESPPPL